MMLPEKLRRMKPYNPDMGAYPVRLDANESFLPVPEALRGDIDAALRAVALHRYPDPLASGVRRLASRLYGVEESCLVAGNGSDELIGLIMTAFAPRGGRVLISEPDFSMYRFYAELLELDCVSLGKVGRRPDADAFCAELKSAQPDLIIFSNPCNPTGLGAPREEVRKLLVAARCPVVVDEAYMDFWDQSILPELDGYPNAIVLKTCSKAYGLAGLRLGFAIAGEAVAEALRMTKSPYNVNALTQAAGEVVLARPDYLRDCTRRIRAAAAALLEDLRAIERRADGLLTVLPTETNFVLVQTDYAVELHEALKAKGILVRKLSARLLRVTAGSEAEQAALTAELAAWVAARVKSE